MKRLRRWWRRRRARKVKPIVEHCSVCGKGLHRGEVCELRSEPNDDLESHFHSLGGGSYMSETYCDEHFPEGATVHYW